MRLELTGRHVEITPSLRRFVDSKVARLERLLNDSALSAQAVLTLEKHRHRADITLHARGEKFLHGVASSATWEMSISVAMDKIARQVQKVKGKWKGRKRRGGVPLEPRLPAETPASRPARIRSRVPRIVRASRQAVKRMSLADAVRHIDAVVDGIIVFRDAETAALSILYRSQKGELTLVETET